MAQPPKRGKFDACKVWDRDEAITAASEAFRIIAEGAGFDGIQFTQD